MFLTLSPLPALEEGFLHSVFHAATEGIPEVEEIEQKAFPRSDRRHRLKQERKKRIAGWLGVLGGAGPVYMDKQLNSQLLIQRCHQLDPLGFCFWSLSLLR